MATATKKKSKKAQQEEALRREMLFDSARAQVLEDLILGTDTNDEDILRARAAEWLEANNFADDVLDLYEDDPAGCIADQVTVLTPEEVLEQLLEEYDEEEIEELIREKLEE